MSTSMLVLNLGLLAWILAANLGTRPVTLRRLLLPLVVVAGVAAGYLEDVPTLGNDVALETALAGAGVLLGVVAGLLVPVFRRAGAASGEPAHSAQSQQSAQSQRSGRSGHGELVMRAGAAYAVLWTAVIGGRIAFAYGAEHWFARDIAQFSRDHLITGSDAWTAAFVLMALAMVVSRVAITALRITRVTRTVTAPVAA